MAAPLLPLLCLLVAFGAVFGLARSRYMAGAIADGDRVWRTGRGSRLAERALTAAAIRAGVRALPIRVLADWETQALTVAGRSGDRILISSGAVATLRPPELVALITHEIGHVVHRHIAHEMRDRALRAAAVAAAATLLFFDLPVGLAVLAVALIGGELLLQAELRRHEREADAFARGSGVGAALARALEQADARDRSLIELTLLLSRTQRRRDPVARSVVAPIERAWGGPAPDQATLNRWLTDLRKLAGPVRVVRRSHRYDGLREIHDPVAVRARRLRTAPRG